MKTFHFLPAISLCVMLAVSACSTDSTIVGKWKRGKYSVEIFKDGTIITTDGTRKEATRGTYSFIKDDTIRMELEGSKPEDFKVTFSRDKLILTRPDGEIYAIYRRAKSFSFF